MNGDYYDFDVLGRLDDLVATGFNRLASINRVEVSADGDCCVTALPEAHLQKATEEKIMALKKNEGEWDEREGQPMWKPEEKGDSIEGQLVKVRTGQYGEIYDIETADGMVAVGSSAVLRSRITKDDEGKTVRIVFDGTQAAKIAGRNPTKLFKVFFKK